MKAYKCDRCGKLYATKPGSVVDPITGKITHPYILDGIDVAVISWSDEDNYNVIPRSKQVDVCEDCANSFILWFKEPYLSEITKGEFTEFEDNI